MHLLTRAALFALLLTFGAVARAQTDAPAGGTEQPQLLTDGPPQTETTDTPPPEHQASPAPAAARAAAPQTARSSTVSAAGPGVRIAAEVLGAALGTAGGVAVSFFGLVPACNLVGIRDQGCLVGAFFILPVGAMIGAPVGAWLFGAVLRGQGSFLAAALGGALGGAGALALSYGLLSLRSGGTLGLMPLTALLPIAGAVLGYEWSHARNAAPLTPLPFAVPGGGGLALAGRF